MGTWTNTNDKGERFRLLCNHPTCSLSLCNIINGKVSVTTIHGNERHSMLFTNSDMLFIISQYIKNLSPNDRQKLIEFFGNF